MLLKESDYLEHYGILRRSGRYPWGSGDTQTKRNKMFLDTINDLKKQGISEPDICKGFSTEAHPFTTTNLRALRSIANAEQKQTKINQALRLQDKGLSNVKIGEVMNLNESSVRSLLAPGAMDKAMQLQNIASMLKKHVDEKSWVDIGAQVERSLPLGDNPGAPIGIAKDKFQTAVAILQEQGYMVHKVGIPQLGTGEETTHKVLAKPGTTQKDAWLNRYEIKQINEQKSEDGGRTLPGQFHPPTSVDAKRIQVAYAQDGGDKQDGLIYLRPGAEGLDMGAARYAQVRIAVNGTHYIKGMAVYKDDLPDGVDILFHSNKDRGTPLLSKDREASQVLKPMEIVKETGKINKENPFTASIKTGGQRGHLNIIYEEGDWDKFSKTLPAQMLSKQTPVLAKQQLDMTFERRVKDFEEISALTNPAVRRSLLKSFSDETDAAAVQLHAAEMKGQSTKVLIPIPAVKPNEIYAPALSDGTRVSLVRFPHAGTFEIPDLTVNNRSRDAKKIFGKSGAIDAVGINHKVAERLSGADFDGDHVLVIPNPLGQIKSSNALADLKGFDPKRAYPKYPGMIPIDAVKGRDQQEMGKITNLIQDMTIQGANPREMAQAVRHSMVIIDAKKHELDYKSSFRDNGIVDLRKKYQGKAAGGAFTLITRAGAEERVLDRKARPAKEGGPIDKATGKKMFVPTGRTYKDRDGNRVLIKRKFDRLAVTDDAHSLVSTIQHPIEHLYADHSNKLKALANSARKEMVHTKNIPYSKSANKVYAEHVATLQAKLNVALKNSPLERQAQVLANKAASARIRANPDLDSDQKKKIRYQELAAMRVRTGAHKQRIEITQPEWDAIQAGAISNHKLEEILRNANPKTVKELATPRQQSLMTGNMQARAHAMLANGFTQAEVAQQLGVSLTTLKKGIK